MLDLHKEHVLSLDCIADSDEICIVQVDRIALCIGQWPGHRTGSRVIWIPFPAVSLTHLVSLGKGLPFRICFPFCKTKMTFIHLCEALWGGQVKRCKTLLLGASWGKELWHYAWKESPRITVIYITSVQPPPTMGGMNLWRFREVVLMWEVKLSLLYFYILL